MHMDADRGSSVSSPPLASPISSEAGEYGFKANGLTNARQLLFTDKARQILGSVEGGFKIVDMFNISLGQPATADGIHYKGGVSPHTMTDMLAHKDEDERDVGVANWS
jgi:hypothetical protein